MSDAQPTDLDPERVALLEALAQQRYFFLHTVECLTDDQARLTPTASSLCLGGLVKHVALTERGWTDFVEHGTMAGGDDADYDAREREFRLLEDETLAEVVALYREVAAHTDELVRTVDLSASHPLPPAPWFTPGERRSARRTFLHLLSELAHHTGHADVIRETVDGQRSMG
ncbi:DinB family protein [Arthrobacter sp. NEB 688]|uniref:DinB family protein n=1 Tax=Arthrobacter sp. NEB 688 TaxID=904039 RepID=UPI001564E98D|nr:DinB family protein [Arthrobacter sp. NEB 688]QKE84526.1 DinB family protein [Arthrobacter sp. NEB 688]